MSSSRLELTQSGDLVRATVQRLSELSLLHLHDLAEAVAKVKPNGDPDLPELTVGGLLPSTIRDTLEDVSGSLHLADIRARQAAHEPNPDKTKERDALLDRLARAAASGELDQARSLADETLASHPGDSLAAVSVGLVRWATGQLDEARSLFQRAQSPEADAGLKADALYLQAVVSAHLGELELAINMLSRSAVTETSLPDDWTRPAARARYEQARLIAQNVTNGTLDAGQTDRCRQSLIEAIEQNGLFFGPAYVDPAFALLPELRAELQDRFNAISLEANVVSNAGLTLVRAIQAKSLVDYNQLQRAREIFETRGFFSRSRLMAVGVRAATRLRDAAGEKLAERFDTVLQIRNDEEAAAKAVRDSGEAAAETEVSKGVESTRALDMRAFTIRQEISDRFRIAEPLQPQHDALAGEVAADRKRRLLIAGIGGVVLLAATMFLPPWWAKLAGGLLVAGVVAWLLLSAQRRYRGEMDRLAGELERALDVQALERNIVVTSEHAQNQSHAVRSQAEEEYRRRMAAAANRFAEGRSDVRRSVEALVQANARFFQTIGGETLPEAQFSPLDVDRAAQSQQPVASERP